MDGPSLCCAQNDCNMMLILCCHAAQSRNNFHLIHLQTKACKKLLLEKNVIESCHFNQYPMTFGIVFLVIFYVLWGDLPLVTWFVNFRDWSRLAAFPNQSPKKQTLWLSHLWELPWKKSVNCFTYLFQWSVGAHTKEYRCTCLFVDLGAPVLLKMLYSIKVLHAKGKWRYLISPTLFAKVQKVTIFLLKNRVNLIFTTRWRISKECICRLIKGVVLWSAEALETR